MTEMHHPSLVKPTLNTPFHIDFAWWQKNERDYRVYLRSYLCSQHQKAFADWEQGDDVDWVDPETAEVRSVDGLQHMLITHCARQENFITQQTALVDSVFRTFLSNGNTPLTPLALAEQLGRQPMVILKTLAGGRVYKGLRPCLG